MVTTRLYSSKNLVYNIIGGIYRIPNSCVAKQSESSSKYLFFIFKGEKALKNGRKEHKDRTPSP